MTDLLLDETGDLAYDAGDLQTVTGDDEIAQSSGIAYSTGLGEWTYDTDAGVAFLGVLARKGATDAEIVAELRRVGKRINGVTEVLEVVLTRDDVTRELTADITLRPGGTIQAVF